MCVKVRGPIMLKGTSGDFTVLGRKDSQTSRLVTRLLPKNHIPAPGWRLTALI